MRVCEHAIPRDTPFTLDFDRCLVAYLLNYYKPLPALDHTPPSLHPNGSYVLLLPEHLLADQHLHTRAIVVVQNFVPLCLSEVDPKVIPVTLVYIELSLHFSDLLVDCLLLLFFLLKPNLMALLF